MLNIRNFSDNELIHQIEVCKNELETEKNKAETHPGEISHLESELYIAKKEAERRGLKEVNNTLHEIYKTCKSMKMKDYNHYLFNDIDIEEKEFFIMINQFFLEREQNRIINKMGV